MPINRELIPALIKAAEERKVPAWKKEYYERVCKALQVHTKGQLFSKVDTLFPHEHPDSKAHCLATYEPITKGSVWKGINNLKRIFAHSSFTMNVGDQLGDWLADFRYEGHNLLQYFLERWIDKGVAEDPNGFFAVYPPDYAMARNMCPVQFIRSELMQSDADGNIAFISEEHSEVQYDMESYGTKREVFVDSIEGANVLNARTCTVTTYNQRLRLKVIRPVVHVFTREGFLSYTSLGNNQYQWEVTDFPNPLQEVPVFVAGGLVADEADQRFYESFVAPFIPFGNLALLQHRNHRAVDLQFSYPRMSELQSPCDYQGCQKGEVRCAVTESTPTGKMPCPRCKGNQFVTVQSPYKVYNPKYDPNDSNNNEHLKVDPVKFYSPDVAIISYSKDAWKDYLKLAEMAIHVQQQQMTGNVESEESKRMNAEGMYAWITDASRCFHNNVRALMQALEGYTARTPVVISVEQPYSFAILTEEEAFTSLTNILASNAPVFIKADRVENFLSKFVSKDSPILRAISVLKLFDPLLFYSTSDIQAFKAQGAITVEQVTRHVMGYPLLLRLLQKDKTVFENNSDEQLADLLEKELPPPPPDPFRNAVSTRLQLEEGTPA